VRSGVLLLAALALLSGPASSLAEGIESALEQGFQAPPASAAPRVWWHWMNGNVTKEGIRLDLEWLKRIGVGGVQTFDTSFETPQVVAQRLIFMSPEWKDAFIYATDLASQLHLELAIGSSPGFSESGAPWVRPEDGMKKLVWSETHLYGGRRFSGQLRQPPDVVGPFQNIPVDRSEAGFGGPPPSEPVPSLYRDVAVVAYRLPDREQAMADARPIVTSSVGAIDASVLWDGDYSRFISLPTSSPEHPSWIQVDFGHPWTVQSVSLGVKRCGDH
jgi:hypothetical protein